MGPSALLAVLGCGGPDPTVSPPDLSVTDTSADRDLLTWHRTVRPLVAYRCVGCHGPGGSQADRPYDRYTDVVADLPAFADAFASSTMPPFLAADTPACAMPAAPRREDGLTESEIATVADWIAAGTPEGTTDHAGILLPPWTETPPAWTRTLDETPSEVEPGVSRCFAYDPGIADTVWIDAAAVAPTDPLAVTRIVAWLDELGAPKTPNDDGWYECDGPQRGMPLVSWHAGSSILLADLGTAYALTDKAEVVVQVHHRVLDDDVHLDAPILQLRWRTTPPAVELESGVTGTDAGDLVSDAGSDGLSTFLIPGGATDHEERLTGLSPWPGDVAIVRIEPRMGAAGRSLELCVTRRSPVDGEAPESCLFAVPDWSVASARAYTWPFAPGLAPVLHEGDEISLRCTYDASDANEDFVAMLAQEGLAPPVDLLAGDHLPAESCSVTWSVATVTTVDGWPHAPPIITEAEPEVAPSVVISEVLDHREVGTVKMVELTNTSAGPVQLATFELWRYPNGAALPEVCSPQPFVLGAGKSARVAALGSSHDFEAIMGELPELECSAVASDGNDAIVLAWNGQVVDTFGVPGEDGAGTTWDHHDAVAHRRLSEAADAVWNPSHWQIVPGSATSTPGEWSVDDATAVPIDTIVAIQSGLAPTSSWVVLSDVVITGIAEDGLYVTSLPPQSQAGLFLWTGGSWGHDTSAFSLGEIVSAVGISEEWSGQTEIDVILALGGSLTSLGGTTTVEPIDVLLDDLLLDPEPWEGVWVRTQGVRMDVGPSIVTADGAGLRLGADLAPLPDLEPGTPLDQIDGILAEDLDGYLLLPPQPGSVVVAE